MMNSTAERLAYLLDQQTLLAAMATNYDPAAGIHIDLCVPGVKGKFLIKTGENLDAIFTAIKIALAEQIKINILFVRRELEELNAVIAKAQAAKEV